MRYIDTLEDAIEAVGECLDLGELSFEDFVELQQFYFRLEYMRRARESGPKYASFAPSDYGINDDGTFTDFGGVKVAGPTNPFTGYTVTIDHVIDVEGEVRVRINGLDLDEVGKKAGSHIA